MARLGLWVAAFIFIVAGILVLFPGFNWQVSLILFAFGAAILFFLIKG
jgi:membrane protein implicated in regulation of membrane protease activity